MTLYMRENFKQLFEYKIQASPILRQPADKTKVYVSWGTEVLLNGNGDDLPVIQIIKIRNHRQLFRSN